MSPGPSPRMWGKPRLARRPHRAARTIPTHVGKTAYCSPTRSVNSDHPHACGENGTSIPAPMRSSGPSPRMWGKPKVALYTSCCIRTIPTHVGKTRLVMLSRCRAADHPHACGENRIVVENGGAYPGPSPRMWGKLHRAAPPV